MEPNKFRESRQAINRKYDKIDKLIEEKAVEESKSGLEDVTADLDALRPEAEGDIQERSVKNLGIKLNHLALRIGKLKVKRPSTRRTGVGKTLIKWDEERIAQLAKPFLEKVYANTQGDAESTIMLGTTGKGIRPNYRIKYSDARIVAFTGSGHKPQEKLPASGDKNLSAPFAREVIKAALDTK